MINTVIPKRLVYYFVYYITPFGEKKFRLITLMAISMAECLVAIKILYCIIILFILKLRLFNII